jgi:hypothetical protein
LSFSALTYGVLPFSPSWFAAGIIDFRPWGDAMDLLIPDLLPVLGERSVSKDRVVSTVLLLF